MGQNEKLKHKKRLTCFLVTALILAVAISAFFVVGACSPTWFSEEGHLQRVSKRIDKKYIQSGEYESFEIRPLYNENDELKYFVVDFKPSGFLYVRIRDNNYFAIFGESMYIIDFYSLFELRPWQRYSLQKVVDEYGKESYQNIYETDENGEYIFYTESCYKMANADTERLYLINGRLPAIKHGDEYMNLIDMQSFRLNYQEEGNKQPVLSIEFNLEWEFNL